MRFLPYMEDGAIVSVTWYKRYKLRSAQGWADFSLPTYPQLTSLLNKNFLFESSNILTGNIIAH